MDQDQNLKEQIQMAESYLNRDSWDCSAEGADIAEALAKRVLALDKWIRDGGALPRSWKKEGE